MKELRLIDQEDRMDLVAPQIVHVGLDGEEEVGGRRRRMKTERVAEEPIEVAPTEVAIAAVREAVARLGHALA
ncbi:MAG: hypothetical protein V9F03_00280 [Microthrixaceae bacterium]